MTKGEEKRSLWRNILEASTVPLNVVVSTFVGLAMGYGLDKLFGTSPYLTFIFLILGIVAGFRELFRFARSQENGNGKEDK